MIPTQKNSAACTYFQGSLVELNWTLEFLAAACIHRLIKKVEKNFLEQKLYAKGENPGDNQWIGG